jgi:PKD repeat protein
VIAVVDAYGDVTEITDANNRATVYMENAAPSARIVADVTSGFVPFTVNFDGSLSSDLENDQVSYSWAYSDGSQNELGIQTSHTFTSQGQYPVTLSVIDEHGAVGTAVVVITAADFVEPLIFEDDFETGNTSKWSNTVGGS